MKKTHKIVMLPTEDALAPLGVMSYSIDSSVKGDVVLAIPEYNGEAITKQHLYIISDDECKVGDWFYGCSGAYKIEEETVVPSKDKKIIATTDPKLTTLLAGGGEGNAMIGRIPPQIPQSLVEYYAKHQPDEVELEYEKVNWEHTNCEGVQFGVYEELKLNNNEVVVKGIIGKQGFNVRFESDWRIPKEKLYTREEVERILLTFREDHTYTFDMTNEEDVKQWLKENL